VEIHIKVNPEHRMVRFPKSLAEAFGRDWIIVPNRVSAVVYPSKADLATVVRSLKRITDELSDQAKLASKS